MHRIGFGRSYPTSGRYVLRKRKASGDLRPRAIRPSERVLDPHAGLEHPRALVPYCGDGDNVAASGRAGKLGPAELHALRWPDHRPLVFLDTLRESSTG